MTRYKYVVQVTGGRDYKDETVIHNSLSRIHIKRPITLLVHGGASGVDTIAGQWAMDHGIPVRVEPAAWGNLKVEGAVVKYGKHGAYNVNAGRDRNKHMFDKYKPNLLVKFNGGTGTAHMLTYARSKVQAGMKCKIVTVDINGTLIVDSKPIRQYSLFE